MGSSRNEAARRLPNCAFEPDAFQRCALSSAAQRIVMQHRGMDAGLEALRGELAAWAEQQTGLRRLWVYGSRAKGTHHPDSDLDIAFELDRLPDEAAAHEFQERTLPAWRLELNRLSGLSVHLEAGVGDASNVAAYVVESGVLVYEREQKMPHNMSFKSRRPEGAA